MLAGLPWPIFLLTIGGGIVEVALERVPLHLKARYWL